MDGRKAQGKGRVSRKEGLRERVLRVYDKLESGWRGNGEKIRKLRSEWEDGGSGRREEVRGGRKWEEGGVRKWEVGGSGRRGGG